MRIATSVLPASTIAAAPADPSALRDIAERILTPRQYEIWTRRTKDGWNEMRIAQWLRVSLRTVEREMQAIRRACREAEIDRREGGVRLGHTIALSGADVRFAPDVTLTQAVRRVERERKRQAV